MTLFFEVRGADAEVVAKSAAEGINGRKAKKFAGFGNRVGF